MLLQRIIVFVLVLGSALFSIWRLLPARRRAQALKGCQACAHGASRLYRREPATSADAAPNRTPGVPRR
jgi:hypothetical protein